jgi:phage gp36-like protein
MSAYCEIADLSQLGIRAEALSSIETENLQAAIGAASAKIDSYLRSRYTLPLADWDTSIREIAVKLSVYLAIKVRGFNPARPNDELIRLDYEDAMRELRDIEAQRMHPQVTDSSVEDGGLSSPGAAAESISCSSRGYYVPDGRIGGAFQGRH